MIPSLLITFREVLEASLIVATILGILTKIGQKSEIKTVWTATIAAGLVSIGILLTSSLIGFNIANMYTGRVEESVEGALLIISAMFITWAVFFLHTHFGKHKTQYLSTLKATIENQEQKGLFVLVFTAVFREGFEIVLFLSTVYFSSSPVHILSGVVTGSLIAILLSYGLFKTTIRLPVYKAFKITSALLILFGAGMLTRGMHELSEFGFIPEFLKITIGVIPHQASLITDVLKSIFGLTRTMDILQLTLYISYITIMSWWVFFRDTRNSNE